MFVENVDNLARPQKNVMARWRAAPRRGCTGKFAELDGSAANSRPAVLARRLRCCPTSTTSRLVSGGILATATASAAYVSATHKHGPQLAELLPSDLDALESPTVIGALGVQLLLFSGCFVLRDGRWVRECSSRPSLLERVERVAPTWKPGGQVDYTWSANAAAAASGTQLSPTLNLFEAAASLPRAVRVATEAATVSSMASSLEAELGMSAADFDAPARAAIREMLTWHLPAPAERRLPAHGDLTLLVLSFDATPHCQSVTDCQQVCVDH